MSQGYWDQYWRRRVSRRTFVAGSGAATIGAAAILAGCGDDNTAKTTPTASGGAGATSTSPAAGDKAKYGGTFRLSSLDPARGFDPQINALQPVFHIPRVYSTTHIYKLSTNEMLLDAAQSIEQPDINTVIYKLRPGIKYHNVAPMNGRELKADDVIYTWRRFPVTKKEKNSNVTDSLWNWIDLDKLQATDASTIRITAKNAFADGLAAMGQPPFGIVAKEAVEANNGDLSTVKTAGSGAYILKDWDPATKATYVRNPDYYKHDNPKASHLPVDGPYMDTLEQRVIADPASTQAALVAGDLDLLYPTAVKVDSVLADQLAKSSNVNVQKGKANNYLALNFDMSKWRDARLREAISLAIDRDAFIKSVYLGDGLYGAPVGSAFKLALTQAELKDLQKFDAQKAKDMWKAGGGDQAFPKIRIPNIPTVPLVNDGSQFIAQQIKKNLGVDVEVSNFDIPAWLAAVQKATAPKDWDLVVTFNEAVKDLASFNGLSGFTPDGSGAVFFFTPDNATSPEVKTLATEVQRLDRAQNQALKAEDRKVKIDELQKYLLKQFAPALALPVQATRYVVTNKRVKNVLLDDISLWENNRLQDVYLEPNKP